MVIITSIAAVTTSLSLSLPRSFSLVILSTWFYPCLSVWLSPSIFSYLILPLSLLNAKWAVKGVRSFVLSDGYASPVCQGEVNLLVSPFWKRIMFVRVLHLSMTALCLYLCLCLSLSLSPAYFDIPPSDCMATEYRICKNVYLLIFLFQIASSFHTFLALKQTDGNCLP